MTTESLTGPATVCNRNKVILVWVICVKLTLPISRSFYRTQLPNKQCQIIRTFSVVACLLLFRAASCKVILFGWPWYWEFCCGGVLVKFTIVTTPCALAFRCWMLILIPLSVPVQIQMETGNLELTQQDKCIYTVVWFRIGLFIFIHFYLFFVCFYVWWYLFCFWDTFFVHFFKNFI